MGFLDFFKHKTKYYSLEEAVRILEERLSAEKNSASRQTAMKLRWEMDQLAKLIEEFSRSPVPDMGKSSAGVKRRFCTLAARQIESLGNPENPDEFLGQVRITLENIGGLTQRQLLHINFFFKDDFRPVARKIQEINALIGKEGSENEKAVEMYRKISKREDQKKDLMKSIESNEKILTREKPELPALARQPDTSGLSKAEAKLSSIKQEVDSFLAIQKVLKKYAYSENIRDQILERYIDSPSSALMSDPGLSVMDHIKKAADLAAEGKFEGDKKLEMIINSSDYLTKKRSELLQAEASVKEERKNYRREQEIFEDSIKARTNMLAEAEAEAKSVEKLLRLEKEECQNVEKEIAKTRAELLMLASRLLDANVA